MALIKCTECNKKFSEYANACPICACPTYIVKKHIESNIRNKKQKLYNNAINIMLNYKSINELYNAKTILEKLGNFKDSIKKIEEINNLLVIEEKQKIYNKAINIISNYKHINDLYDAKRLFKLLKDFKDSNEKIKYIEQTLIYNEMQKQKIYNETIEIVLNYKTIDDLYIALKKFQELDGFKDSYKKIEEIKVLLNFENECKKINIKGFIKILVIVIIIIILVCLGICLFIDKKSNNLYEENDRFNNYLTDEIYDYLKDESYDLYKNEINKLINVLEVDGYKKKCRYVGLGFKDHSIIEYYTEDCDEIDDIIYLHKDDEENENQQYFFDVDEALFVYKITNQSKITYLYYDLLSNKGNFSFHSANDGWIYLEKDYNNSFTSCWNSEYVISIKEYELEHYIPFRQYIYDCETLVSIEGEMDNLKNEITNFVEKANVDINNIKKYFKVRDEYFQKYD